jgi:cobalt-zinc-cadmium resistance protein CzcA
MQRQVERRSLSYPEVAFVYSKTGTAEVASDPMPPNASDTFIILKPKGPWPDGVETKDDVIERVEKKLEPLVGNALKSASRSSLRFNELIAGVRGDIAIKIYGDDLDEMGRTAQQVARCSGPSKVRPT